jgi:hypothetical protein
MRPNTRSGLCRAAAIAVGCLAATSALMADDAHRPFVPTLINSSTIPADGDVNPYGVAFVPEGFPGGGLIASHDVLVSNFNNSNNLQGTGTTIVRFDPTGALAPPGTADTFFTSPLPGLSTALGVLRAGFVVVGNVPTTDGTSATVGQGALQIIDRHGAVLATWTDPVFLDGPWDLTVHDEGVRAQIFVSNVLNGTVVRLDVTIASGKPLLAHRRLLATGYTHRPDMAALVLGPTGLAYDVRSDTLFVASTADNAIYAIARAGTTSASVHRGRLVFSDRHLRGPLALRFAPNGDLLTANGDAINADPLHPSEIVEFTVHGRFVSEYDVDSSQGGAFGLDVLSDSDGAFNYAAIDDVTNSLAVYRLSEHSPH